MPLSPERTMAKLRIESRDNPTEELELISSEVTIGRGVGNTIHFRDPWLSRTHARIVARDRLHVIEDLSSRNGTFVNGAAITESKVLIDGDVITLGDLRLTFLEQSSTTLHVADAALPLVGKGTVILNSEDLRLDRYQEAYRQARNKEKAAVADPSEAWWLALNEAASALISHFPLDQLVQRIIELVLRAVPAERGALLLRREGKANLEVMARRGYTDREEIRISKTIIEVVLEAKNAILTLDARSDERFDSAVSILMQGIRSILCVPLVNNDREVIGLIYLDDRLASEVFTESALRLVGLIANMAAVKVENCYLLEQQIEKKRMEEQLAVGSQIQRGLLPSEEPIIEGYELFAGYQSCFEVGGDYYDFIQKEDGKLALVIADISGKGVGAALLMAVLQASLRALVNTVADPAELIRQLNRVLVDSSPHNKFATIFYAELNPATHELEYVSGGHNPTLLAVGNEIRELSSSGPVVGIVPGATFRSHRVELPPGSTLVLYTDGVTELNDELGEEFGCDRLAAVVLESHGQDLRWLVERVHDRMVAFARSHRFDDDSTLVVLRRKSPGSGTDEPMKSGS